MPQISELSIQNIRSFGSVQQARLGRVTLLVGENNAGKSTFLGCYNAFANLSSLVEWNECNPFDVSPFFMGSFDTIAGPYADHFTIAGRYENHIHTAAQFCFGHTDKGQPIEQTVEFTFPSADGSSTCIRISIEDGNVQDRKCLLFEAPNFLFRINWADISDIPIIRWLSSYVRHGFLPYNADRATFEKCRGSTEPSEEVSEFIKFINFFRSEMPLPKKRGFCVTALEPNVPARQRIYQTLPSYLDDPQELGRISHIGTKLGLWDEITVTSTDSDDGMEVDVTVAGKSYNLMEAGYSIHALLPIVHAISTTGMPSIFLLQQPEIHVHPIVQARLAQYMAEGSHHYIIETHSDHLVDRFRLCVLDKVLNPDELSILYFEKCNRGPETRIHNISVDSQGNIVDPPDSYREFFLTETERLLGFHQAG